MMAPAKVAAFHIGAHKTGTSVLQRCLRDNAESLSRSGMLVLTRADMGQYIRWGDALIKTPERLAGRLERFSGDLQHDILFGSNENAIGRPFLPRGRGRLYPRAPRNIRALAAAMSGGIRPRIFLSIRPQAEFLESYYLQTVHEGSWATFAQWLERIDFRRLSWRPLVTTLRESFGDENVEIVDFRLIRSGQDAYVHRFLRALSDRFDQPVTIEGSVNRSISGKGLQLALAANPLLPKRADRGALRRFLQRHFSNVDYPRPVLLTESQRRELDHRYAAEYDDLVKPTGSPLDTAGSDA